MYQDANQGNGSDFSFVNSKQIQISPYANKDWTMTTTTLNQVTHTSLYTYNDIIVITCIYTIQLSRAEVDGYKGVGEPPIIVMTLASVNRFFRPKQGICFTVVIDEIASANTITVSRAVEPVSTSYALFTPELQGWFRKIYLSATNLI